MAGRVASTSATCGARKPIPTPSFALVLVWTIVRPPSSAALDLSLDFGLATATHEPVTGARGYVNPGITLVIFLRGPGARRVRRLAVVLAGFGDPIALLRLELGLWSWPSLGDSGQGQSGGKGGGHEETGRLHRLHRVSPYL